MEDINRITESSRQSEIQSSNNRINLAVLGTKLVGKTALIYRFLNDNIPSTRETTVEDQYKKVLNINDIQCELNILDTAGKDEYQTMLESWIEFSSCFLLVYSIDNKDSLKQVKIYYEKIAQKKGKQFFSVLIVGNKCDLDNNRQIRKEEAEIYGNSIGVEVLETSALNNINVNEAFLKLVQIYIDKNKDGENNSKKVGCPCF